MVQVLPALVDDKLMLRLKLNFVLEVPKSSAVMLLSNGIGATYLDFPPMMVAVAATLIFILINIFSCLFFFLLNSLFLALFSLSFFAKVYFMHERDACIDNYC